MEINFINKESICLCQHYDWFGTQPAERIEMKHGVKIPWDTGVLCTYSMSKTLFAN